MALDLPERIDFCEVGPRDGLQNEKELISTEDKIAMVNALSATGVKRIEVTSFVRPDAVPQMADAAEVMAGITRNPDVEYAVLVPNVRGYERAMDYDPDVVNIVVAATETFNQRNVRMGVDANMDASAEICLRASNTGKLITAVLATAFWCPFEGKTDLSRVLQLTKRFVDMGVTELSVADTIGAADPKQVYDTIAAMKAAHPDLKVGMHLHDTRGMGIANGLAAASAGASWLEGSIGGLGGCPFAPGAKGNAATEDLIYMLERMGVETGIDVDALLEAGALVKEFMGRPLNSKLLDAGKAPEPGQLA